MTRATSFTVLSVLCLSLSCGGGGGPTDAGDAALDAAPRDTEVGDIGSPRDGGTAGGDADGAVGLGPPYPIVLAHGFFGFDDFAGAGFVTYFYDVRETLAADGEELVFTPEVDPFNSSAVRAAQLAARIDEILAMTGHAKVNIIGHSQGGLDARIVAHDRPGLVASVTTFATPHRGTAVADVVLGIVSDGRLRDLVDELVRIIGAPLYDASGEETSVVAALAQLSGEGIAELNASYPDRIDVDYYSIAGVTNFGWGSACRSADAPPWIDRYASYRDPVDPLLFISEAILDGGLTNPFPNDGLVRVVDARWGRFLGCVPADHLDEVGQLFGDSPGLGNDFDHRQLFVDLVRFLRAEGH